MFIFLVFLKSHITMFDVDTLERLRDELLIKECQLQRLLKWYSPLDIVLKKNGTLRRRVRRKKTRRFGMVSKTFKLASKTNQSTTSFFGTVAS